MEGTKMERNGFTEMLREMLSDDDMPNGLRELLSAKAELKTPQQIATEANLAGKEVEIKHLNGAISALSERLTETKAKNEKDVSSLKDEIAKLKEKCYESEEEFASLSESIQEIKDQCDGYAKTLTTIQNLLKNHTDVVKPSTKRSALIALINELSAAAGLK